MKKIIDLVMVVVFSNMFSLNVQPVNLSVTHVDPRPAARILWINPVVPSPLQEITRAWNLQETDDVNLSTIHLSVAQPDEFLSKETKLSIRWFYVLVTPFPTLTTGISEKEFHQIWQGERAGPFDGHPILMDKATSDALSLRWGAPARGSIRIVPEEELLDKAWDSMPSWAIIPFENIQPRWKVLEIGGQSPIHEGFDENTYPLVMDFTLSSDQHLNGINLPASNRDPAKFTSLIMTGVTALTRATAHRMEQKGVTYPGEEVRDILLDADLTHISNEVPFYSGCPEPNPKQEKEVFCSSTRYMELLTHVDADIIELTGNHFGDFGPKAMLESLAMYDEQGMPHYGGGADLDDSLQPLKLENHGNKIAFIGCNEPDVGSFPTATETRPGAAPCDFEYMSGKIKELTEQGYLVIATFQWSEGPTPIPYVDQVKTFRLMADSGAVIVNGSQAHIPQIMEFRDGSFIHYGLGNLWFDQTGGKGSWIQQREFIDRHVFYDGRYLGVELITTFLEDYSRPRLMTEEERADFLTEYFELSGWLSPGGSKP